MTLPHKVLRFPIFLLFGLFAIASAFQKPAQAASQLTITPSTVRFGDVIVGQSETLPAVVTNAGTSSFTLSTITGSTGEYTVNYPSLPLTLSPGQSTTLQITFNPTVTGTADGTIAINGGTASVNLHGYGTLIKTLASNPASVSFGNVPDGGTSKAYVTLTNTRNGNVNIASELTKGAAFSAIGFSTPLTLTPGQSFTFVAEFSPTATGWFNGTIQALNAKGDVIVAIPLSGSGTAAGQLALSPTSVSFGNVNLGSNASQTATLTASGASVTLTSASSSNSEFSISGISFPQTIAAGQSVSYLVTFTPQSSGSASSTLSFASNASNSASELLSGSGLSPNYSVSLTWNASSSQVSGYNVYRGTVSGGPYAKLNSAVDASTTYSDGSVAASNTYYYVTTAVSSTGQESGYSNQVQVVVP